MGIIKKNGINYTAPGAGGGGGTPVEYIEETAMQELYDAGTWTVDTLYLVMHDDSITIFETFYNGEFYLLSGGGGRVSMTEMDLQQWNNEVGSTLIDDWDVTNLNDGWYFVYDDNNGNTLRYIVHIIDAKESEYDTPIVNYSPGEQSRIVLMTQSQYNAIIDGGEWPEGFAFCTDSNNFYWQDHTIVENTPHTPTP